MKKISVFCTVLLVLVLCVLPFMAHAESVEIDLPAAGEIVKADAEATPGELPAEFTWTYLVTTGGAAVFVFAVVQFAKAPLDKVWHIPTRLLVYILSFATLLVANAFLNHGLQIETVALSVFNALISAYGAYGMYEVWAKKNE